MSRRASGLVVTRPSTARSLLASLGVAPASRRSTGTVTLALGRLHAPRSGHSEPARSPGWFGCYCLVSRALTSQPASQSVPACLLPASSHTAAPYRTYNLISAPACPHPPHGVPSPFPRPARSIPRPVQRRHRLPRSKPGPERPTLVCRPAGCRCRRSRVALVLQACPWPAPSRARPAPAGGQPRSTAAPGAPSQAAHTAHVGRGFIQAPRGMHVGPLRRLGLRGALPHNRPQRRPNHRPPSLPAPRLQSPDGSTGAGQQTSLAPCCPGCLSLSSRMASLEPPISSLRRVGLATVSAARMALGRHLRDKARRAPPSPPLAQPDCDVAPVPPPSANNAQALPVLLLIT